MCELNNILSPCSMAKESLFLLSKSYCKCPKGDMQCTDCNRKTRCMLSHVDRRKDRGAGIIYSISSEFYLFHISIYCNTVNKES